MATSAFFRCARCRKVHMLYSGTMCPCGEPFPYEFADHVTRSASAPR